MSSISPSLNTLIFEPVPVEELYHGRSSYVAHHVAVPANMPIPPPALVPAPCATSTRAPLRRNGDCLPRTMSGLQAWLGRNASNKAAMEKNLRSERKRDGAFDAAVAAEKEKKMKLISSLLDKNSAALIAETTVLVISGNNEFKN